MELIRDHYNDCTEKEKNTEGQGKENSGAIVVMISEQ